MKDKNYKRIFDNRTIEELKAQYGYNVVLPKSNQLQVDIDDEESYALCMRRIEDIKEFTDWDFDWKETTSPGGNKHITITVQNKRFSQYERIALQCMFGSDRIREGLNALRHICGVENPVRFFEVL